MTRPRRHRPRSLRARALTVVVAAVTSVALVAGCESRPDRLPGAAPDEEFVEGHVYVQPVGPTNCVYDAAHGGVVFDFHIIGHLDANVVAEIQQPEPGRYHAAGPVVASATAQIRDGDHTSPMRLVVPFDEATWQTRRDTYRCRLQTDNLDAVLLPARD
jgi:hypothetical protein